MEEFGHRRLGFRLAQTSPTHHQIQDNKIFINGFLNLHVFRKNLLQSCARGIERNKEDGVGFLRRLRRDSPWLCGQSSRWKMTIRGLLLKGRVPLVSGFHQVTSTQDCRSPSPTWTWTSREPLHRSEPRSADPPTLDRQGHHRDQNQYYPNKQQPKFSRESGIMRQTSGQQLRDPPPGLWDVLPLSGRHHQDQKG